MRTEPPNRCDEAFEKWYAENLRGRRTLARFIWEAAWRAAQPTSESYTPWRITDEYTDQSIKEQPSESSIFGKASDWPGEPGYYHTPDPDLKRREISVVNDAFNSHISEKPRSYESFADYREGFFEGYYRASTEPVSLEACARACAKASGFDSKASARHYIGPAKAVLDAAGVPYVD